MTPTQQTVFGDKGNCFEACIASFFDMDIKDVPDFNAYEEGGVWMRHLNNWLAPQGLVYFEGRIPHTEIEEFFRDKDFYHIMIAPTMRSSEICHAVIGRKGKMLFDPHPDNVGIIKEKNGLRFGVFVKTFVLINESVQVSP